MQPFSTGAILASAADSSQDWLSKPSAVSSTSSMSEGAHSTPSHFQFTLPPTGTSFDSPAQLLTPPDSALTLDSQPPPLPFQTASSLFDHPILPSLKTHDERLPSLPTSISHSTTDLDTPSFQNNNNHLSKDLRHPLPEIATPNLTPLVDQGQGPLSRPPFLGGAQSYSRGQTNFWNQGSMNAVWEKNQDLSGAAVNATERARAANARLLYMGIDSNGATTLLPSLPSLSTTSSPSAGMTLPLPPSFVDASTGGAEVDSEKMDTLAAVRGLLGIAGEGTSSSSNASDVDAEGTPDDDLLNFLPPLPVPQEWNAILNAPNQPDFLGRKPSLPHLLAATTTMSYSPGLVAAELGDEEEDDDDDEEGEDATYIDGPVIPRGRGPRTHLSSAHGNKRPRSSSQSSSSLSQPSAYPSPGAMGHGHNQSTHVAAAPQAHPVRARTTALPNKRRYRASTTSGTGNYRCLHPAPDGTTCPVSFRRSYDLARHKESKHREGKGTKSNWICKGCGGEFARKDSLQRHALNKGHNAGV